MLKDMSNKLNPFFVTGFTEGEGSFYVAVYPRQKNKIGWEVRPSFSLSQNKRDKTLLYMLKDFFASGTIRPNRKDNTLKYEVRDLNSLKNIIIPHFDSYPLRGKKKDDFIIFRHIVFLMLREGHLTKQGLKQIVDLVVKMAKHPYRQESLTKIQALLNE